MADSKLDRQCIISFENTTLHGTDREMSGASYFTLVSFNWSWSPKRIENIGDTFKRLPPSSKTFLNDFYCFLLELGPILYYFVINLI